MKDLINIVYEKYLSKIKDDDSKEYKEVLSDKANLEVYKQVWKEIQQMSFDDFCKKKPSVAFVKDTKAYEITIPL